MRGALSAWAARWNRPVAARALRLTRALTGWVAVLYFLRHAWSAPRYLAQDGLLPTPVVEAIYWYTWQPLLRPGFPEAWASAVPLLGAAAALGLALGWRSRACAVVAYVVAVCLYRRIFPLMYIDDGVLHLALFWQVVLPHPARGTRWAPGAAVRCACVNLALVYVIAGASKLLSPMWRDGTALWAILRNPLAWWPEALPTTPSLHLLDWVALAVEPAMLLVFVLPAFHRLKAPVLLGGLALHLGNVVLLDVAVANLACLALWPLAVHAELAPGAAPRGEAPGRWSWGARVAAVMVAALVPAMALATTLGRWRTPAFERAEDPEAWVSAEAGGRVQTALYGVLWAMGLAQSYRLLDWIDDRDAWIVERRLETDGPAVPTEVVMGRGAREVLLSSYLAGASWTPLAMQDLLTLRRALADGMARQGCAAAPGAPPWRGRFTFVYGRVSRPEAVPQRFELTFGCADGAPTEVRFAPARPPSIGDGPSGRGEAR